MTGDWDKDAAIRAALNDLSRVFVEHVDALASEGAITIAMPIGAMMVTARVDVTPLRPVG